MTELLERGRQARWRQERHERLIRLFASTPVEHVAGGQQERFWHLLHVARDVEHHQAKAALDRRCRWVTGRKAERNRRRRFRERDEQFRLETCAVVR